MWGGVPRWVRGGGVGLSSDGVLGQVWGGIVQVGWDGVSGWAWDDIGVPGQDGMGGTDPTCECGVVSMLTWMGSLGRRRFYGMGGTGPTGRCGVVFSPCRQTPGGEGVAPYLCRMGSLG